jgi:glycosyltransferase involved in cell wall biosynthesis
VSDRWILLIAYHFPPENVIGTARPYRFYKYLQRHGYKCHVITAADVSQLPEVSAERVADPFLESPGAGSGWHVERAVRKFLLPGTLGTQWALHAYRAGRRFLREHRGDQVIIFSTFPPLGTHLAAWRLSRSTGVPWIADYRDPLTGNPVTAQLGKHTQAAYRWLDRTFVHSASEVIANTDAAQEALKSRFPDQAAKINLIWNGFDPEERLSPGVLPACPVRLLSHVGELYAGRNVAPLLESMARLIDHGRLSPGQFRVRLVGPAEASCLPSPEFTKAAETRGWLEIVSDQRPRSEAQQIARSSHTLLIVQPQSAVQVPAKVFEYLQIGRPILAYVPRNSSVERLLEPSGIPFRCIYPDDPPGLIDDKIVSFFQLDPTPAKPSAWFEETFNAEAQTVALAQLVERSLTR